MEDLRPCVLKVDQVLSVSAAVSRAVTSENILVDPLPVDVVHVDLVPQRFRPAVALVDHQSRVRVSTAHLVRAVVSRVRSLVSCIVNVIADCLDVVVDKWIEILR